MPADDRPAAPEPHAPNATVQDDEARLGVAELAALVETSRVLGQEVHLPRLLHRILEQASALTESRDASVLLLDESRNALYFADALGEAAPMLLAQWGRRGAQRVPLIGSKAGQVFTSTTSLVVDAVATDPVHFKGVDRATHQATQSMVCVPLVAPAREGGEPRVLGVVQLLNKRQGRYGARDRVLLERFADQAAIAIDNARLVADLFAAKGLYAADLDEIDPQEVLARPAWHETLTVLMADMRGFTQLCQVIVRPERTQELLNEFLSMLAASVVAHRGVVNKFLGDGLMAFFRHGEHAADAVACAFDCLAGFDAMKARWNDAHNVKLDFLDLGVGVSTEDVILGTLGSERVWDFTAIGTGVNLAAHLMEHARGGRRLLVDKVTFRAAQEHVAEFDGPEEFELRKPGQSVAHPYERYLLKRRRGDTPQAPDERGRRAATAAPTAAPCRLFVSYSHHDAPWLQMLRTHLQPYVQAGSVELWDDTTIEAGDDWHQAIAQALDRATVALFLVTPQLLASPFVREQELAPMLQRAAEHNVRLLWVPVVASSYEETPFKRLQAALNPKLPLDQLPAPRQHQELVKLCKRIKALVAA